MVKKQCIERGKNPYQTSWNRLFIVKYLLGWMSNSSSSAIFYKHSIVLFNSYTTHTQTHTNTHLHTRIAFYCAAPFQYN